MRLRYLCLPLLLALALPCTVQAKQLVLVAQAGNPAANITSAELLKIFHEHAPKWPDGRPISLVLRDPSSPEMELVLRKLLIMTPEQAQALIGAHKSNIVVADSDDAILKFVSATRGAIGIVDLYSLTKDVKVLKIDGKLPVDQGYLLRGNSQ